MRTIFPDTRVNLDTPLWSVVPTGQTQGGEAAVEWGGWSLRTEGQVPGPLGGRLSAPSSPFPESQGRWQHQLQSRRGIGAGARGSFPIFHPNSECDLKGHASPAGPHRSPSNAQAGLYGCAPGLTLTSSSEVLGDTLTRRTGDLWVLE